MKTWRPYVHLQSHEDLVSDSVVYMNQQCVLGDGSETRSRNDEDGDDLIVDEE